MYVYYLFVSKLGKIIDLIQKWRQTRTEPHLNFLENEISAQISAVLRGYKFGVVEACDKIGSKEDD
jgi:hypothetical protein